VGKLSSSIAHSVKSDRVAMIVRHRRTGIGADTIVLGDVGQHRHQLAIVRGQGSARVHDAER
jgi:hypothetical protein